jgi:hypothetical protein
MVALLALLNEGGRRVGKFLLRLRSESDRNKFILSVVESVDGPTAHHLLSRDDVGEEFTIDGGTPTNSYSLEQVS